MNIKLSKSIKTSKSFEHVDGMENNNQEIGITITDSTRKLNKDNMVQFFRASVVMITVVRQA